MPKYDIDSADRTERIKAAIEMMDPKDADEFTNDGKPDTRQIAKILSETVTAKERDTAWSDYLAGAARDPERKWSVICRNARGEVQYHESCGVHYPLSATKPCKMPAEHAMVFLKDPAFIVRDESDVLVETIAANARADADKAVRLMPNQVIASLTELTDDALRTRLMMVPGGQHVSPQAGREVMIDFILSARDRTLPRGAMPDAPHSDLEDTEEGELGFMGPKPPLPNAPAA